MLAAHVQSAAMSSEPQAVLSRSEAARRTARGLAGLTILAAAWVTWRWMSQNDPLYIYDPADHLNEAGKFARQPWDYFKVNNQWWAPLYHMLLGCVLWLNDDSVRGSTAVVNLGFFSLLAWSTFKIGESLHSPAAGAVAVSVLLSYPAIFIHLRHPMLDLPLTAMTSVTVMALMRCGPFEHRWSVLVGVLGGLGMLTKQSFAAGLLLPAAHSVSGIRSRRGIAHATAALALALVIALPYYYPRLSFYRGYWQSAQNAYALSRGDLGPSTQFGLVSPLVGVWHQASLGLTVAWLISLPRFLRSERRAELTLWFAGTLAFVTFLPLRDTRYMMPALPAMALMTAVGLMKGRFAALSIGLTITFGALQLWAVSFDAPWWPRGSPVSNGVAPAERFQLLTQRFHLLGNPKPDPNGLGVARGLASLEGRVGVFGNRIVRDAILSRHVGVRRAPRVRSVTLISNCSDPFLPLMDHVVWQIGGPSAPSLEPTPGDCLVHFRQTGHLRVTDPEFLLGARELLIFAPRRLAPGADSLHPGPRGPR